MDNIAQTTPHYVRCICSNYQQQPVTFDSPVVLHQLNCAGILDCVRIRMLGYPIRRSYTGFVARYKSLIPKALLEDPEERSVVEKYFGSEVGAEFTGMFQYGTTKVFMKDKISRIFEDKRTEVLGKLVVPIQRGLVLVPDPFFFFFLTSSFDSFFLFQHTGLTLTESTISS